MKKKDFEFGKRILVKNRLKRSEKTVPTKHGARTKKVWKEPIPQLNNFEPTEGIFLGYRTVSNGYRRIWSDHIEYNPTEYYTVALVAIDPNKNPFYSTDIEILEQ